MHENRIPVGKRSWIGWESTLLEVKNSFAAQANEHPSKKQPKKEAAKLLGSILVIGVGHSGITSNQTMQLAKVTTCKLTRLAAFSVPKTTLLVD